MRLRHSLVVRSRHAGYRVATRPLRCLAQQVLARLPMSPGEHPGSAAGSCCGRGPACAGALAGRRPRSGAQGSWDAPGWSYEIGIYGVDLPRIIELNEGYLGHCGATDVITFDYGKPVGAPPNAAWVRGDIFICLDEAVRQGRRYRVSRKRELARYVIHGLLHLAGFDDLDPGSRRWMKSWEDRLLRTVAAETLTFVDASTA